MPLPHRRSEKEGFHFRRMRWLNRKAARSFAIRLGWWCYSDCLEETWGCGGTSGKRTESLEAQQRGTNHDVVSESAGLEQNGEKWTPPSLPSCFPRPLTLPPLSTGKLWHQLGATDAFGGPSCCWSPSSPRSPGSGFPLSQGGTSLLLTPSLSPQPLPQNLFPSLMTLFLPRPGSPYGSFAMGAGSALQLERARSLSSSTSRIRANWEPSLQSPRALSCLLHCPSEGPNGSRTVPQL